MGFIERLAYDSQNGRVIAEDRERDEKLKDKQYEILRAEIDRQREVTRTLALKVREFIKAHPALPTHSLKEAIAQAHRDYLPQ